MQQAALVFDLDGTVGDSLPDLRAASPPQKITSLLKCLLANSGYKGVNQ